MNARCKSCESGTNCINGRWCTVLKKYVEYSNKAECDN